MCGILGTIPATSPRLFQQVLNILRHRGPDGEGIWHHKEQHISLGHRLLSIIGDKNQGLQPTHFQHLSLVYNGEIYNYQQIKRELQVNGYQFLTNTDSEVVLLAFHCWGANCLSRFNGMWAFAIWDNESKRLFLSRDRFGKKPLFYSKSIGEFFFASEMKAILPLLGEVRPNKNFVGLAARYDAYESGEETLIENVCRFPAGSYGWYQNDKLKITKYWNTADHLVEVPNSYTAQVSMFRELLEKAVSHRLHADVKTGCALSGGLDSSSIASFISQLLEHSRYQFHKAFVATFPDSPNDEQHQAQKVLEKLKLPVKWVPISAKLALENLSNDIYHSEEIWRTPPSPMSQLYAAMREEGVYVSLEGHGPDELLSGYGNFLQLANLDIGLFDFKQQHNIYTAYQRALGKTGSPSLFISWMAYCKALSWYQWKGKQVYPLAQQATTINAISHFNGLLSQLFHASIFPSLLRNYDRYSMQHGVEVRMPFVDYNVVNFCFSIPMQSKIRNGWNKSILRDTVKPHLGNDLAFQTKKTGFTSPLPQWFKGYWKEFLLDVLHSSSFQQSELVNSRLVKKKVLKVMGKPGASITEGEEAWLSIVPYFWEQYFLNSQLHKIKE
ncbi:MAG: asparagine synthase (glutamine-hydrolyzing) [Chitinophagales bacterium]|nr:asparagine synthase (glutamine-hydrolyzing) [Chitinophagales bacterium]